MKVWSAAVDNRLIEIRDGLSISTPSVQLLPAVRNSATSHHLDFIRGLAAFAVLAYHIRYRFFVDYQDVELQTLLSKAFYFVTAFGHDAVMVFFVLSGFLISSTVIRDHKLRKWSWRKYSADRLTRLYVVLILGLILTLAWDQAGLSFFGTNPIYTGNAAEWRNDYFDVPSRLNAETFLGNTLFVQTILVQPLGSNDPLWSLAYEFWYYLLFPVLFIAFGRSTRTTTRLGLILIASAIMLFVGKLIVFYFPIWLLGGLVCVVPKSPLFSNFRFYRFAFWSSLLLFGLLTLVGHLSLIKELFGGSVLGGDYLTATSFAPTPLRFGSWASS